MADLAIGLSKKVVDGLVKKVEGAIKEEQDLWQIVERDSAFIKDEFETMKSFLMTADRDRVRNTVVRTWVRQVRDLSYDAEDCMDDVLELEPKRPWWALSFWPRMLPTCCRPRVGKALDEAVDKIKLIKARVEEVSHRNLRYNLINATGSQQAATAMDMDLAKVQEGSSVLRSLMDYESSHVRLNVISVWGTGGNLGTIAIIRNAFDNPLVCKAHQHRAWVKLMHPFSPKKFLGDLVAQLFTNSRATTSWADVLSEMEATPVDHAKKVEQLLKGHSYLIILEDLSNMEEWYTIRTYLPDDENGSQQVIVSTQHRRIARLCIGQPQYVHELSQLSADDCVYAFFEEVRIPSEQNRSSTNVASSSAAANYLYHLPSIYRHDSYVSQLCGQISKNVVVTVLSPPNTGKDDHTANFISKFCFQLVLGRLKLHNNLSFELYGWVNVSSPIKNVAGLARNLLSLLRPNSRYHSTDPIGECSHLLRKHRCLVVIYGLQYTQDCLALEAAGLIDSNNHNSRIVVVTTPESGVSKHWTKAECKIEPIAHESPLCRQQVRLLLRTMGGAISPITAGPPSELWHYFSNHWYRYCLTGRDEEISRLRDMISSSRGHQNINGIRVLTVWGLPGVEKDTLVDLVAKVCSHYVLIDPSLFQLYGWVDVSSNSNPEEISLEGFFSQSLLSTLPPKLTVPLPIETDDTTDPIQDCINLLTNNRCLVVTDGLKSVEDCKKLIDAGLIDGHPNSCIILITEQESVAKFWKQRSSPYAVCSIKPLKVKQQEQLPTPRSMPDNITRLFYMANSWFPEYSPIIGRDGEVGRLRSMISSSTDQSNTTRVVIIWGPPGVGKTALVEKVYSQFVLNRWSTGSSFGRFGWVQVSNPFNLMEFSRSLLSVLSPESPQSPDPVQDCSILVLFQPCLIVIDGLQCMENYWELVNAGLIYGHAKSCTVLITREKDVTTRMASLVPPDALFQVKPLDRQSAIELFTKVYPRELPNSIINSDCDLVDKCCGVPIVILAMAKYLSRLSNTQVTQFKADVKDGKFIHELATNTLLEFVGLKGLFDWVDSDLKACAESLKLLIMYMFNFSQEILSRKDIVPPETAWEAVVLIRRKRLVWRWIAEGYIKNTGICDMVTEAEERVRELEDLTMMMIQVPSGPGGRDTWPRGYQLSGFSAEVLMSRAAEDPLFLPLEVSALTEGKRSLTSRGCAGRHLRIDDEKQWERSEFVFRSLDLSRLRSLTVSGRFEAFFINDRMRVLRVLDLEDATDVQYNHLEEISKLLRGLRFLSLRGCREIDRLPNSIGDLRLLQTLDIRRTKITELPNSIMNLQHLHCLRAGHTMKARTEGDPYTPWRRRISSRLHSLASWSRQALRCASQGVTMPRGMRSQLTALHTLGIVNVNTAGGEAILQELRHLKQLRKLELYGINSYNVRGLKHLPSNLDSLSLGFTKDKDASSSSFNILSDLPGSRLKLQGHVGIVQVLPAGLGVTDLTLEIDTRLTGDHMECIGNLPMVRTLRLHLHENCSLEFVATGLGGFPKLEVLEITGLHNMQRIEFAPETVKSLMELKFAGPPSPVISRSVGLHHLPSLKEVWIDYPSQETREVLEQHPNNPAIIDIWRWEYLYCRETFSGEYVTGKLGTH